MCVRACVCVSNVRLFLSFLSLKGVEKIVEFIEEGGGEYVDIAKELREEFK